MGVRKQWVYIPADLQSVETLTICSRSFVVLYVVRYTGWCCAVLVGYSNGIHCVVLCCVMLCCVVLRCVAFHLAPPPPCPFQVSPGAEGAQSRVLEEGDWNGREDWVQGMQRVCKLYLCMYIRI